MTTSTEANTLHRVSKRDFETAYNDGQRVAVTKDAGAFGRGLGVGVIGSDPFEIPGPVGFTSETVSLDDVYSDGPYRYFVVLSTRELVAG